MVSSTNRLDESVLFDSPIPFVFSTYSVMQTQLSYPDSLKIRYGRALFVPSCNGILCFTTNQGCAVLWNPSIRTFKILPHLNDTRRLDHLPIYSFGYDHFIHNYKIIAISFLPGKNENEVRVHTLSTDSWRRIPDFPCSHISSTPGLFVSGTANWWTYDTSNNHCHAIVSLDLEKETYQKLSQPDLENSNLWILGVLKDCLCIFANNTRAMILDVWVMKEYGNKNSWTKLYNISYMHVWGVYASTKILYINVDDQMLLEFLEFPSFKSKLGLYDYKIGTLKIRENKNSNQWIDPVVYVESLILPSS